MKKMIVSFLKKNMFGMLTLCVMQADAQVLAMWSNASDGFRSVAKIQSGAPSNNPSRINELVDNHTVAKLFQERHGSEIEKFMGQLKTRIVLVSSDRQIIYQNYATRSMRNSTPLGYSMSKSVAAITIGHAICSNSKVSIQSKVDGLLPRLKGTSWGNSTIEDLLLMKSGSAKINPTEGNGWQSEEVAAIHRPVYLGGHNIDVIDLMIKHDLKEFTPGTSHQYSNYDTIVLGLLVESITQKKFYEYFFDTVWKEVAAAKTGAWIVNGFDQTFTSLGFSASPEDWLRLGHYVIDQINSQNCVGKFLQNASEPKEKTYLKTRCYGYQIWNWCRKDAFFFFGYGGQFLIIRPEKKWVAYVHQTTHDNDAKIIGILYESLNLLN